MAKRKAAELGNGSHEVPRRSSRRIAAANEDVDVKDAQEEQIVRPKVEERTPKATKGATNQVNGANTAKSKVIDKTVDGDSKPLPPITQTPSGRQFWLMKAEPESRIEKGKDIKFSIDDLASKSEPEPWDGIRAYPARNNLRAMKKGDLAFFYHSSCKIPAIVGIMEIVAEHTPDLTAHDSSAPYYDPKSSPDNPKWSVVHVEFRQKLETPVTLKEMKEWQAQKDSPLANMQMLKLTRLSVSAVTENEWNFLIEVIEKNGEKLLVK